MLVDSARLPFATVGVGASAGGLQALERLLAAMPRDAGVAVVIVTHQHPSHISLLPELLARHSVVPVEPARDGLDLAPNHVYVCPPGKDVVLAAGRLQLVDPIREGALHLPIDRFFRSLARDQAERAICLVLSGTGTDGTLGLRAIKAHGGMALVQDEHSASYAGMPLSAKGTRLADFVLPPNEMPARLLPFARALRDTQAAPGDGALSEALSAVFTLLQQRTGHDFKSYKAHAMRSRVERRMRIHEINEPAEYVSFLRSNPHEIELLFSELLINVTSFFRDPEAFEKLDSILTDRLLEQGWERPLRAWVVGCSTGEEAYSIGMLLSEIAGRSRRHLDAQIFGTDLDENAIDQARVGLYPHGVASDVGPERLARFFTPERNGYRIKQEIRDLVVFATQNVVRDPPFTQLDLVSCRNLLIYLGADLQQRLIPMFHYVLKPGGLLLLGTSETIGGFEQLFEPLDRKHRIFARQATATGVASADWLARHAWAAPAVITNARSSSAASAVFGTLEKLLLQRFVPPSVIVNQNGNIVYIQGRTGHYLELSRGAPQNNLFAMAREGLELGLSIAMRVASAEDREIVQHDVDFRSDGGDTRVTLVVRRLDEPESVRGLFRVSFLATETEAGQARSSRPRPRNTRGMLEQLDQTRRALQISNEELQSSNEELKSMNEELQSTNEELQSSNEELGTSKEELQALNEQLQALNLELQAKMNDLTRANDDMSNLLNSTESATLFLDRELKIQRFTERARRVIQLIPSDIGRPLGELVSHLRYAGLADDAERVLETLLPHEVEVQTTDGQWRLLRMLPYRTARNAIDGVVITLIDIERIKRTELLAARAFAENIVRTVREPLVVLDGNFVVVSANLAFVEAFGAGETRFEAQSLFDLGGELFDSPTIRALLEDLRAHGTAVQDCEIVQAFPGLGPRRMSLNACKLMGGAEVGDHMLLTLADISGRSPAAPAPTGPQ